MQRNALASWNLLTRALAEALTDLGDKEYLVISCPPGNRYVQFAGGSDGSVRMEATSNHYLDHSPMVLDVEDYERMQALGWNRATHSPDGPADPRFDQHGSPNFFVDLASPSTFPVAAALATSTIYKVFRVTDPAQLTYRAFSQSGASIRFPALRVRRDEG